MSLLWQFQVLKIFRCFCFPDVFLMSPTWTHKKKNPFHNFLTEFMLAPPLPVILGGGEEWEWVREETFAWSRVKKQKGSCRNHKSKSYWGIKGQGPRRDRSTSFSIFPLLRRRCVSVILLSLATWGTEIVSICEVFPDFIFKNLPNLSRGRPWTFYCRRNVDKHHGQFLLGFKNTLLPFCQK